MPDAIPISQLPSITNPAVTDLFPRVDMTQATPGNRTQQSTLAQLLIFIQQNVAMVYPCTLDPNAETVSAFFGSMAIGSDNGSIWQKQTAGYTNSGWVQILG